MDIGSQAILKRRVAQAKRTHRTTTSTQYFGNIRQKALRFSALRASDCLGLYDNKCHLSSRPCTPMGKHWTR